MKKLLSIVWLICAYVNWGLTMGYFTHRFPDQDHVDVSIFMAVIGPWGTIVSIVFDHPMHWRVKPATTDERWEYFQKSAPKLGREYFEKYYN